jgi:hypothetical protein
MWHDRWFAGGIIGAGRLSGHRDAVSLPRSPGSWAIAYRYGIGRRRLP